MTGVDEDWAEASNIRRRPRNARQGRAGVIAVETACNRLDLIWRNLLEEDVGIDGTIEVALGDFPTGKLVCAQVKSGMSYIRSETSDNFRFYPDKADLAYWQALSIGSVLNSVYGAAVENQAAMARTKRSPNRTAN